MRAVVQRVIRASVTVDDEIVGSIGPGLVVLLGVGHDDTVADGAALVSKLLGLRIFADDEGKMNRSIIDAGGSMLVVSQFTLLAELRKGRRPSFVDAAPPSVAAPLVDSVVDMVRSRGVAVETGEFGAHMRVDLENDGPVTIVIDVEDGSVQ